MATTTYQAIYRLLESLPVISTHEHHLPDARQAGLTLDRLMEFEGSYVGWLDMSPGRDAASRADFLAQVRHNSYFVWLEKGIQRIYGLNEKITAANWDDVSRRITERHLDSSAHIGILRQTGRYVRGIEDAYWDPASDSGHPELFSTTFRCDMFVRGFHPDVRDHDNMNPFVRYPEAPSDSLEHYLDFIEGLIDQWRGRGGVSFKSASAYERSLAYGDSDWSAAEQVFGRRPEQVTPAERDAFESFMLNWFCGEAEIQKVPFQVHTGLGQLSGSRPMLFESTLVRHPNVRFVLFHAGFPWYGEVAALAHNHSNVLIDMVWAPMISPTAAVSALHQFLEVAHSSDRIAWGSDTWTSEEAVGALLAWQHVVATVLSEKVDTGYLDMAEAEALAHKLMYRNAARLYGFALP